MSRSAGSGAAESTRWNQSSPISAPSLPSLLHGRRSDFPQGLRTARSDVSSKVISVVVRLKEEPQALPNKAPRRSRSSLNRSAPRRLAANLPQRRVTAARTELVASLSPLDSCAEGRGFGIGTPGQVLRRRIHGKQPRTRSRICDPYPTRHQRHGDGRKYSTPAFARASDRPRPGS